MEEQKDNVTVNAELPVTVGHGGSREQMQDTKFRTSGAVQRAARLRLKHD